VLTAILLGGMLEDAGDRPVRHEIIAIYELDKRFYVVFGNDD